MAEVGFSALPVWDWLQGGPVLHFPQALSSVRVGARGDTNKARSANRPMHDKVSRMDAIVDAIGFVDEERLGAIVEFYVIVRLLRFLCRCELRA